jgi:DNA-directed RNA polymerase specialized sigma subunit
MKDVNNLTPQAISAWFRYQAKKFTEIAEYVEGTFTAAGLPHIRKNGIMTSVPRKAPDFTAENVRAQVRKRGMRRADIAEFFGVSIEDVEKMIENTKNGLFVAPKAGWVRTAHP